MSFVADFFYRGGPFVWLLLLLVPVSLVLIGARFALVRKIQLPGVGMAVAGMFLSTGVMADGIGMRQAIAAVQHATSEVQSLLLDAGFTVSRIPLDAGVLMGAVATLLLVIGWARGLGADVPRPASGRLCLALSSFSLILALVAGGLLLSQRMPAMEALSAGQPIAYLWEASHTITALTWATWVGVLSFLSGAAGSCLAMGSAIKTQKRWYAYGRSTSR